MESIEFAKRHFNGSIGYEEDANAMAESGRDDQFEEQLPQQFQEERSHQQMIVKTEDDGP